MAQRKARAARKSAPKPFLPLIPQLQVLPGAEEKKLFEAVRADVAKNMNVPLNQLPADVTNEIDRQVKSALSDSIRDVARIQVSQSVKGKLSQGVSLQNVMRDRLKGALTGLQTVNAQVETQQILAQNASLLRAKFDALKAVQFTDDQAFQIILTELGRPRR